MLDKLIKYAVCGILMSLSIVAGAQGIHRIEELPLGSVISKHDFDALGVLKSLDIDGKKYFIVPARNGKNFTIVLDANYRVGRADNQVSIVEQPTEKVRAQLAGLIGEAASVKYYDHMNITLIRYESLEQAAAALKDIRHAMPGAAVGLPMTFSQTRIR